MRKLKRASKSEPTTALINIVFLILIFFMVTGTLDKQKTGDVEFVQSAGLECCVPPDAIVVDVNATVTLMGEPIAHVESRLDEIMRDDGSVRILPDRALPAAELLKLISLLKDAGAGQIVIVTEAEA